MSADELRYYQTIAIRLSLPVYFEDKVFFKEGVSVVYYRLATSATPTKLPTVASTSDSYIDTLIESHAICI